MSAAADAAHFEGVGLQSYGTAFEVVSYDCNNHLFPLIFAHHIGSEYQETWNLIFRKCKEISGFDIPFGTTIVDQEKSIDSAYMSVMQHAKMFLDPLHVRKNMNPHLGTSKKEGLYAYNIAIAAANIEDVEYWKEKYTSTQAAYLRKFPDAQLYRAYYDLMDQTLTSQGAASRMAAAIRNNIRGVEPQQMLYNLGRTQRERFIKRQEEALSCQKPVPPYVEQCLACFIQTANEKYSNTLQWMDSVNTTEATVRSITDPSQIRTIQFINGLKAPPSCCKFSNTGIGYPCSHGVAAIIDKYGFANVHKFVHPHNLTAAWKSQYDGITFDIPTQNQVDEVILAAKKLVQSGGHLRIPKAIPPPRGRPPKNAGKWLRNFYERGPANAKKLSYSCSLCGKDGHVSTTCPYQQLFSASQGRTDEENHD